MTPEQIKTSCLADLSLLNYDTIQVLNLLYSDAITIEDIDSILLYSHLDLASALGDSQLAFKISLICDAFEETEAIAQVS